MIKQVEIGTQIWMTQNLDVTHFRNGDLIPLAKSDEEWAKAGECEQPAWCHYDYDPINGEKYGKLYNWYALNDLRGLAPTNWHIPTDEEWLELVKYLETNADVETRAGKKMKNTSGWLGDFNGTNESGFAGLPGGFCYDLGGFNHIGNFGYWWSSIEVDTEFASVRSLVGQMFNRSCDILITKHFKKSGGVSIRCVMD